MLSKNSFFKKCYLIRKTENKFLEIFKEGKISGTVHTCVGQEYSGVLVSKYFKKGDLVVSNHRGHGHYISITNDINGLVGELLGKDIGSSKGIGGSQHLINDGFISNGIQGGMTPIASGYALASKLNSKKNISYIFIGDGTLGEGIIYETFNICSKWNVPVVFILENNGIAQSTSMKQSFSGDIKKRVEGFGLNYYEGSIYDLDDLDNQISNAEKMARDASPSFINIELSRLNSHSKGDDNRDEDLINKLKQKDPLNIFLKNNKSLKEEWDLEFDKLISDAVELSNKSENHDLKSSEIFKVEKSQFVNQTYKLINTRKSKQRFNDLIHNFFKKFFQNNERSFMLGEDIETFNNYNPKEYGGAFKVTKDLSQLFSKKIKNTPISEQAITGFGIGLSLGGYTTFVEIMFGDFSTLIFDQLYQHASKINLMFGKKVPLPLVVRTPMGGYRGYGPTHSQSIEKHFLGIPGLKVLALNQLIDPELVYNSASKENNPILMIENKMLYTRKLYENFVDGYELSTIGEKYPVAKLFSNDDDPVFTIVSYGGVVNEILLALKNIFIEEEYVCDLFCPTEISNIDIPGLVKSISITKKLLIVEEGSSYAAFGSELVAVLLEKKNVDFQLFRISNNGIIPSSRELELELLPSPQKITSIILNNI